MVQQCSEGVCEQVEVADQVEAADFDNGLLPGAEHDGDAADFFLCSCTL